MLTTALPAQVAAVVTSFATQQVLKCWDDRSINSDQVIASILTALHHPFNIDFNSPDQLQRGMFQVVTRWWTDKSNEQRDVLRRHLLKSTIAAGQHKYLISNPDHWRNLRTFGTKPADDKSLVDRVVDNITDAVKQGVVEIPQQALKEIVNVIQSLPTPEIPNPVDVALSMIPVSIPIVSLFNGVSAQAIMAAPTMGNMLKDVFSFW